MGRQIEYRTVKEFGRAEIIEKKSKFISSVMPVESEKEAQNFINKIKTQYFDARHNVFAYMIDNNIQRYSDDGEPSGTAGIPTLEVIKKEGIINIVIVTTRYFGGILLGAGGLNRAYTKSAKEGILAANIVEMKLCNVLKLICDYQLLGKVQNEIANNGYNIKEIIYEKNVILYILVDYTDTESFTSWLINISNGSVSPEIVGKQYTENQERGV